MVKRSAEGPSKAVNHDAVLARKRRRTAAPAPADAAHALLDQMFGAQATQAANFPLRGGVGLGAGAPPARAQEAGLAASPSHPGVRQNLFGLPPSDDWADAAVRLPALLGFDDWFQRPTPELPLPGTPRAAAPSLQAQEPAAPTSDAFLPGFASLAGAQAQEILRASQNGPIFSDLQATPQAGPMGDLEVAAMLLALTPLPVPRLEIDAALQALRTPDGESSLRSWLAGGASAPTQAMGAPYAPAVSPFYEGEKLKGMSTAKKRAFGEALVQRNQGVAEHQRVQLVGPVRVEKMSIFTGARNSYVVSGKIAQGTYGKFRGAICLETGEAFGVKELRSERAPLPKAGQRANTCVTPDRQTKSELDLLTLVSYSLKVHEVVDYRGKIYVFLPWMAGDASALSRARLSAHERFCTGRSLAYQVTCDLEACHHAGYIHHDLKLLNILWHANGTIAVSDFGLARQIGSTYFCGTPGMYAPELLARRSYGPEVDMWSLGITYFHFLMSHRRLPLSWSGASNRAIRKALALNERFFAWRESVKDAYGRIDPARIRASHEDFGPYFSEALQADGPMTWLFLQHVLAPAHERDSSQAFRQRMEAQGVYVLQTQQDAQVATRRVVEQDDSKRNIVGALQARRNQILRASP